jgi:DHA2 family multidrug resistance protein-like MFS transporter
MDETNGLPAGRRRWVMMCTLSGVILAGLDSAIANIALPTVASDLAATDAATIWVVNSYQLAVTVCLLPAATLGESLSSLRRLDQRMDVRFALAMAL